VERLETDDSGKLLKGHFRHILPGHRRGGFTLPTVTGTMRDRSGSEYRSAGGELVGGWGSALLAPPTYTHEII
jgi:hypothetical protein